MDRSMYCCTSRAGEGRGSSLTLGKTMKSIVIFLLVIITLGLVIYYTPGSKSPPPISYADGLKNMRLLYHNKRWSQGGPQVVAVFDTLVSELTAIGKDGAEEEKLACFRRADAALHEIYRTKRPIRRNEIDQLQSAGVMMTFASRLDPTKYGSVDTSPLTIIRE